MTFIKIIVFLWRLNKYLHHDYIFIAHKETWDCKYLRMYDITLLFPSRRTDLMYQRRSCTWPRPEHLLLDHLHVHFTKFSCPRHRTSRPWKRLRGRETHPRLLPMGAFHAVLPSKIFLPINKYQSLKIADFFVIDREVFVLRCAMYDVIFLRASKSDLLPLKFLLLETGLKRDHNFSIQFHDVCVRWNNVILDVIDN